MKLPIGKILTRTAGVIAAKRAALLRALILPATALTLFELLVDFRPESILLGLAVTPVDLIVTTVYLVSCHRIVLLGDAAIPNRWGVYFTERELRFLLWSLLLGVIMAGILLVALAILFFVAFTLPGFAAYQYRAIGVAVGAAFAVILYVDARLSLVFPVTAVGRDASLRESWRLTSGNGWRLASILGIAAAPVFAIVAYLMLGVTPPGGFVTKLLLIFLSSMLSSIGVTALSLAYEELTAAART
ncbi:MAG TPA: hypothetical protein VNI57_15400, partial [Candidatus Saccharimonadales bacterium]|nr:hypothetical protein [Candidatus Saccharimonadales bacterium]